MKKLIPIFKKIKRFVQFHDWVWSVAAAFFIYLLVNYGPPQVLNVPMAYFSINWPQWLIATAGVVAGLFAIARLGLWSYFRKLHDYIYGFKKEGVYHNPSFHDFKNKITAWQRLLLVSFWLLVLLVIATIVFLRFIPLSAPA